MLRYLVLTKFQKILTQSVRVSKLEKDREYSQPKIDSTKTQSKEPISNKEKLILEKLDLSGMSEWPQKLQVMARNLLCSYSHIFSKHDLDMGKTDLIKHHIQLTEYDPFKESYRKIPPHLYDEIRIHLKEMLESGPIRRSQSPWSSATVLVRKKDGKLRFYIDFRKLNMRTVKDNYSLPRIEDQLEQLQLIGAEWFSTLDLKSGYWQIELTEEAKPYTAFTCGQLGFYGCNMMTFGASNIPATFQRLMEIVWGTSILIGM